MHAYLLIGNNAHEQERQIKSIAGKNKAVVLDYPISTINDIRELTKIIKLSLSEKTIFLLKNFHKVRAEAQNAFLKTLEEPQENLVFILTTDNEEQLLPTIISRCHLINLKSKKASKEDVQSAKEFLELSTSGKLSQTSKITKREDAIEFIINLLNGGHKLMQSDQNLLVFVDEASQTLNALEANGNVQLQLTNFVVQTSLLS